MVLSVLLARSLGPPRSEVLWDSLLCKRLWAFYDVRAWLSRFSLSPRSSFGPFWSFYSRTLGLSRSEVRGPFRSSLRRRALSGFLRRPRFGLSVLLWSDSVHLTEVRGLSGLSTLGLSVSRLSRSEVRGPFRSSLRRRRFPAFSDVRALVSRSFCGRTLYIWQRSAVSLVFLLSVSRSFEVRGPRSFRSSLRRRRFPAFSDVRAFSFGPFSVRTPPILIGVPGLSVSHCTDSVLRGPRSADSGSVLQIGWLRIFFQINCIWLVSCSTYLPYIRRHELMYAVATSRVMTCLNPRQSWLVDCI